MICNGYYLYYEDVGDMMFLDAGGVFKQHGQPYDLSVVKLSDYV